MVIKCAGVGDQNGKNGVKYYRENSERKGGDKDMTLEVTSYGCLILAREERISKTIELLWCWHIDKSIGMLR